MGSCATGTRDHPYLKAKNVQSYGLRRYDHALVMPLRDGAGTLWSLQFIDPDCKKRFLTDGKKKGCDLFLLPFPIKQSCQPVMVKKKKVVEQGVSRISFRQLGNQPILFIVTES